VTDEGNSILRIPASGSGGNSRRRVLIAGAGRTGRRLAERLVAHWSVTLLDLRQDRLDLLRALLVEQSSSSDTPGDSRWERCVCMVGDATSRMVLERAGAALADCVVAACDMDVTNLEICRLALQSFDAPQIAAVVREPSLLPQFQALGVQTVLAGMPLALALANRIEPAVQASEGLGLGHGEVMELTLPASSPVLGQELSMFSAQDWLIAAVYRQGELIVPHGWTRLQEQDRILLVGSPIILPGVADYLRLGRAQFPYPAGSRLAVVLEKPDDAGMLAVREAQQLMEQSAADGLDFLAWGEGNRWKQWAQPLAETVGVEEADLSALPVFHRSTDRPSERWGCLVIAAQRAGWRRRFGWRRTLLDEALDYAGKPVLVARGSLPYRRVVSLVQSDRVVTPSAASLKGLQAALSLGSALSLEVRVLIITAPAFIAGESVTTTRQELDQAILTLAATYRMRVERQQLTGNPIREAQALLGEHDLLVARTFPPARPALFRPDVGRYLALRARCSVLVIPDK